MISISLEELESMTQIINEDRKTLRRDMKELSEDMHKLQAIWKSDTCDEYVEQFEEYRESFKQLNKLLNEMTDNMKMISGYGRSLVEQKKSSAASTQSDIKSKFSSNAESSEVYDADFDEIDD